MFSKRILFFVLVLLQDTPQSDRRLSHCSLLGEHRSGQTIPAPHQGPHPQEQEPGQHRPHGLQRKSANTSSSNMSDQTQTSEISFNGRKELKFGETDKSRLCVRVSLELHFKDSGLFSCPQLINDANFKKEGIFFCDSGSTRWDFLIRKSPHLVFQQM